MVARKTNDHSEADRKLREVLNRLPGAKVWCEDVETSGLDWRRHFICGYVVTFGPAPQDSYYIPFRHQGPGNVGGHAGPRSETGWNGKLAPGEAELTAALNRPDVLVFGHNFGFDLKFKMRTGRCDLLSRYEDTYINAPLLDEWVGKYSLENCAIRAQVQHKKSQEITDHICRLFPEAAKAPKEAMGYFWRLAGNDPIAVAYAEGDGTTTWQLRDWQMKQIAAEELDRAHDVESRLIKVLARMTFRGIKIDLERLEWLEHYIDGELERLRNSLPSGFNVLGGKDVRDWMERHGHTDWPMTAPSVRFPDGQPSFTEAWLENYPAGRQILDIRKLGNLSTSFILPLKNTHMFNGRVHTNFHQLRNDQFGTVTGRLSSTDPNLQAVHKRNERLGRLYRSAFIPDEGKFWSTNDYSQIEPRLLAAYSGCAALIEGYRADPPVDAHTTAAILCNRNWDSLSPAERKDRRETGKRINQTLITGGGRGVLVEKYKVPQSEVDRVWREYFKAMPEIRSLQNRSSAKMRERQYVMSLLGRRARLVSLDKSYIALNRLLQCGNADILKLKLVEMDDYLESVGRPIDLLLNCHDAFDMQMEEEARPHYNELIRIALDFGPTAVIKLSIPMAIESGEGRTWAEATYGPDKEAKTEPPPANKKTVRKARKRAA